MIAAMLSGKGRTAGQALRQDKLLCLPDKDAWPPISPSRPTETRPIFCARRLDDIHKFSMIPDLTTKTLPPMPQVWR